LRTLDFEYFGGRIIKFKNSSPVLTSHGNGTIAQSDGDFILAVHSNHPTISNGLAVN